MYSIIVFWLLLRRSYQMPNDSGPVAIMSPYSLPTHDIHTSVGLEDDYSRGLTKEEIQKSMEFLLNNMEKIQQKANESNLSRFLPTKGSESVYEDAVSSIEDSQKSIEDSVSIEERDVGLLNQINTPYVIPNIDKTHSIQLDAKNGKDNTKNSEKNRKLALNLYEELVVSVNDIKVAQSLATSCKIQNHEVEKPPNKQKNQPNYKTIYVYNVLPKKEVENENPETEYEKLPLMNEILGMKGRRIPKVKEKPVDVLVPNDEDNKLMDTLYLIKKEKYNGEKHSLQTKDRYILSLYRITSGKTPNNSINKTQKQSVLLAPGLFNNSDIFVLNEPKNSLAFMLADSNYDVWIMNFRGSIYSKHETISMEDPEFWNYSLDELAVYDLPAVIDYILKITDKFQIHFIGHSISVSVLTLMMAQNQNYFNKIRGTIALAPIDFTTKVSTFFEQFSNTNDKRMNSCTILKEEFMDTCTQELVDDIPDELHNQCFCTNALLLATKSKCIKIDQGRKKQILSRLYVNESVILIKHIIQISKSGKFHKYDYGRNKNKIKYKQNSAPAYDLKKDNPNLIPKNGLRMVIYYSERDAFSGDSKLLSFMRHGDIAITRKHNRYSHMDFVLANDLNDFLQFDLIPILKTEKRSQYRDKIKELQEKEDNWYRDGIPRKRR